jgi:hypothetical protein
MITMEQALKQFETYLSASEKHLSSTPTISRIRDLPVDRSPLTQILKFYSKFSISGNECEDQFGNEILKLQQAHPKWNKLYWDGIEKKNSLSNTQRTQLKLKLKLKSQEKEQAKVSPAAPVNTRFVETDKSSSQMLRSGSSRLHARLSRRNSLVRMWTATAEFDKAQCKELC